MEETAPYCAGGGARSLPGGGRQHVKVWRNEIHRLDADLLVCHMDNPTLYVRKPLAARSLEAVEVRAGLEPVDPNVGS